jgi:Protein of unknown function (DUF998)
MRKTTRAGSLPGAEATAATPMRFGLAVLALASVAAFGATLVALHLLRADVLPVAQGISHYGNGPYSWLLPVANGFLGVGGLALVLGLAFGVAPVGRSVAGLALLGLWSVAQLITAFFPIDAPGAPPTIAGTIHGLAGLSFLAATTAALLLTRGFRRDTRWAAFARPAGALALALLAAALVLYVLIEPFAGLGIGGAAQRVYWALLLAWLAWTALGLCNVAAGSRTQTVDPSPPVGRNPDSTT